MVKYEIFNFATGLAMTNQKFSNYLDIKLGSKPRITYPFPMDIASSIQGSLKCSFKLVKNIKELLKIYVWLEVLQNCVANGKIVKNKIFENIWIQPASGDAGGSLGAALAFGTELSKPRQIIKSKDTITALILARNLMKKKLKIV